MTVTTIFQDNTSRVLKIRERIIEAIEDAPQGTTLSEVLGVMEIIKAELVTAAQQTREL